MTGIDVPLEVAMILCVMTLTGGLLAGHAGSRRRAGPHPAMLAGLPPAAGQAGAIDLAIQRNAARARSHAVMHARISGQVGLFDTMDADSRKALLTSVVGVMRTGLRRDDNIAVCDRDGITITIAGANERAAVRIADRLQRSLARLSPSGLGGGGITARFGIAASSAPVSAATLIRRAREALDAAQAQGRDHVVAASEIEDVMLLPPPSAASAA